MACPGSAEGCKVFVGGLSWSTDASRLRNYFQNWGAVEDAFVSYDRDTGRPRGFGFVVFSDPRVADRVISLQHTVDRREVEAKKAVPKVEQAAIKPLNGVFSSRTKKIFVGGLAPTVDETVFRLYFERFGEVEDAVVMYDHECRRSRGFGFITFASEDTVDQVLQQGNMQTLHDKPIEIKRAVPREQMPASTRNGTRPVSAAYASAARPFGPALTKSAAFSLADVGLPATGLPVQGSYSFPGLTPRLGSLSPGSLGIPALRTPNSPLDYTEALPDSISAAQGLDLLLNSQPHRPAGAGALNPGLGGLGLDDLALLQTTGLAANMGHGPAADISAAQSLPSNFEEMLQGLHLGQGLPSRHSQGLLPNEALGNALLASTSASLTPSGLGAFDHQAISTGQHW